MIPIISVENQTNTAYRDTLKVRHMWLHCPRVRGRPLPGVSAGGGQQAGRGPPASGAARLCIAVQPEPRTPPPRGLQAGEPLPAAGRRGGSSSSSTSQDLKINTS